MGGSQTWLCEWVRLILIYLMIWLTLRPGSSRVRLLWLWLWLCNFYQWGSSNFLSRFPPGQPPFWNRWTRSLDMCTSAASALDLYVLTDKFWPRWYSPKIESKWCQSKSQNRCNACTVEPWYKDHLWAAAKVVFIVRWSLYWGGSGCDLGCTNWIPCINLILAFSSYLSN